MQNGIDEILEELKGHDKENYAELIQSYPLGYVYIAYNLKDRRITTLDRTRPLTDYVIYWTNTRVVQLSAGRMSVLIPDILYKSNFLSSTVVGFAREVGKSQRIPIGTPSVRMWFELLVDDREKLIWLIGFREEKPTDE